MWTEPEPAGTPLRKNKNTHTLSSFVFDLIYYSSAPHKQVTFNKVNRWKRMNRVSRKCLYACYRFSQTALPSADSPHLCCLRVSLETCHLAKRLSFESDLHKPHDRTRHRRENSFACRRNHTEVWRSHKGTNMFSPPPSPSIIYCNTRKWRNTVKRFHSIKIWIGK